jgi:hypothetical protein
MRPGEFVANVEVYSELVAATSAPERSKGDD